MQSKSFRVILRWWMIRPRHGIRLIRRLWSVRCRRQGREEALLVISRALLMIL